MSLPSRDDIRLSLLPLAPLFRDSVLKARGVCDIRLIAAAGPHITRVAHLRRLSGTQRWMVIADDLVAREADMPAGYGVLSTDADHNRGRYAFQFPMGVLTIRRDPHEDDDGRYIQERLEGIEEQVQLASGIDAFAGFLAYLSVPPSGPVRIIVTHAALEEPVVILLDELEDEGEDEGNVVPLSPRKPPPRTTVRSKRKLEEADEDVDEDS